MLKKIFQINWAVTILFNLKYFSIGNALKFPVLLFGRFDLQKLGGVITIADTIILRTGMVKIGVHSVGIFDKSKKTILNIHGEIIFNGSAIIGRGSALSVGKDSKLNFGDNFEITASSSIMASGGRNISIGDNCLVSWDVLIMSTDFHKIIKDGVIVNMPADVIIGNEVWICARAIILKGSNISNGSIIGADSIVNNALDVQNAIYVGNPIIKVKNNILWEK